MARKASPIVTEISTLLADFSNGVRAMQLAQEPLMAKRFANYSADMTASEMREVLTELLTGTKEEEIKHELMMRAETLRMWAEAGLPREVVVHFASLMLQHEIMQKDQFWTQTGFILKTIHTLMIEEVCPGAMDEIVAAFRKDGLFEWRIHTTARSQSRPQHFADHIHMRLHNAWEIRPDLPEGARLSIVLMSMRAGLKGYETILELSGFNAPDDLIALGRKLNERLISTINEGLGGPMGEFPFELAPIKDPGFLSGWQQG